MQNSTLRWLLHLSKATFDNKCGFENFEILSVFPCAWFWSIQTQFAKIALIPGILVKYGVALLFSSISIILNIWAQFPQIRLMHQIPYSRYKLNLESSFHLIYISLNGKCGVEDFGFTFMYWFLWFGVYWLSFPNLPYLMPQIP